MLEMKAVQLVLNAFPDRLTEESVVLRSYNSTIMVYLKKQGGTVSKAMCDLAQEIMMWSEFHSGAISMRYIAGKMNIRADQLNRPNQVLPTEWSLFSPGIRHLLRGI